MTDYAVFPRKVGLLNKFCTYEVDEDNRPVGRALNTHGTSDGAKEQLKSLYKREMVKGALEKLRDAIERGGSGSGNHGHSGRPGMLGGSGEGEKTDSKDKVEGSKSVIMSQRNYVKSLLEKFPARSPISPKLLNLGELSDLLASKSDLLPSGRVSTLKYTNSLLEKYPRESPIPARLFNLGDLDALLNDDPRTMSQKNWDALAKDERDTRESVRPY